MQKQCGIDATKIVYALKNAAKEFLWELLRVFSEMECRRNNAYPCMYFKWIAMGMLAWLS